MPEPFICTQTLGVFVHRDAFGHALYYSPGPLQWEERAPAQIRLPISQWEAVQLEIQTLEDNVRKLLIKASFGEPRGDLAIEPSAAILARHILPPLGFVGMFKSRVHPQFDSQHDEASNIPWEALEERYYQCSDPQCHKIERYDDAGPDPTVRFCSFCGRQMTVCGGKLALSYHLTHCVRGTEYSGPTRNDFLLVLDPTDDLCKKEVDQSGICGCHLEKVYGIVKDLGYTVCLLKGANATRDRVLEQIARPELMGIYYFGHGCSAKDGNKGFLKLADGNLYAPQIEEAAPQAPFIFLNACEGAGAGSVPDREQRARSVVEAFTRGHADKVVIATRWPVMNVQAAQSALEFFTVAKDGTPLAAALHQVRRSSYDRYRDGAPDIGWMAYRYFGDPNTRLPDPSRPGMTSRARDRANASPLLWLLDDRDQLDLKRFSFPMIDILFRAAKRRNIQGRRYVSPMDLMCGVIRRGALTRHVFQTLQVDPDDLYERQLTQQDERGPGDVAPQEPTLARSDLSTDADPNDEKLQAFRRLLARWFARDKGDFHQRTLDVLIAAGRMAQSTNQDVQMPSLSEEAVLLAFAAQPEWSAWANSGFPPATAVQRVLADRQRRGLVNENGVVSLARLDAKARRIVETAHELSQQRGQREIPTRLLMAAFLADTEGFAAERCRAIEVDPKTIFGIMLAITEKKTPDRFVLSPDVCRRIVYPVLDEADRIVRASELVSEKALFEAFHRVVPADFKKMLLTPPLLLDLDALFGPSGKRGEAIEPQTKTNDKKLDVLPYDGQVTSALEKAAAFARQQGSEAVRTPHLFAAICAVRKAPPQGVSIPGLSLDELIQCVLALVRERPPIDGPMNTLLMSENVTSVLLRANRVAREQSCDAVGLSHVEAAFFANGGGVVGDLLRQLAGPPG